MGKTAPLPKEEEAPPKRRRGTAAAHVEKSTTESGTTLKKTEPRSTSPKMDPSCPVCLCQHHAQHLARSWLRARVVVPSSLRALVHLETARMFGLRLVEESVACKKLCRRSLGSCSFEGRISSSASTPARTSTFLSTPSWARKVTRLIQRDRSDSSIPMFFMGMSWNVSSSARGSIAVEDWNEPTTAFGKQVIRRFATRVDWSLP